MAVKSAAKDGLTGLEIAVTGMSGRFPGARDIEEFRDNLEKGKETIAFFSHKELEETGVDAHLIKDANYVGAAALAAVNISLPVFYLFAAVVFMLAVGGSVMCGKFLGEKNLAEARAIFTRTLIASLIVALGIVSINAVPTAMAASDLRALKLDVIILLYLCLFYFVFYSVVVLSLI